MKDEDLLSIIKELKEEIKTIKNYKVEYNPTSPIIYNSENINYINLNLYSIISKDGSKISLISQEDIGVKDETLSYLLLKSSFEKEFNNIISFLDSLNNNHPFFISKNTNSIINLNHINYIYTSKDLFLFSIFNHVKNDFAIAKSKSGELFVSNIKYNNETINKNKNIFQLDDNLLINLNNLSTIDIVPFKKKYVLVFTFFNKNDLKKQLKLDYESKNEAKEALNKITSYSQSLFNKNFKFKYSNNVLSL